MQSEFSPRAIDASECVSNGWALVQTKYWTYFAISLLVIFAPLALSCIPCLNIILVGPLSVTLLAGVYFVILRDMRGEPVDFSMMFKGFENIVPLLIVGLIQAIPSMIFQSVQWVIDIGRIVKQVGDATRQGGDFFQQASDPPFVLTGTIIALIVIVAVVMFVFSLAWAITFEFAVPLVIDKRLNALDAIKLSARAGWSNVGGLLLLMLFQFLLMLAGFIALCFGIFFVAPVLFAARAFAYRQVFPILDQPSQPQTPYTDFAQQPL